MEDLTEFEQCYILLHSVCQRSHTGQFLDFSFNSLLISLCFKKVFGIGGGK